MQALKFYFINFAILNIFWNKGFFIITNISHICKLLLKFVSRKDVFTINRKESLEISSWKI